MATYKYQQTKGSSYVKYNITPDFGTPIAPGDKITIKGEAYCSSFAIKSFGVDVVSDNVGGPGAIKNVSVAKSTAFTFSLSVEMSDIEFSTRSERFPVWFTFSNKTWLEGTLVETDKVAAQEVEVLRYRLNLQALSQNFYRCGQVSGSWAETDEGTSVMGAMKLAMNADAVASDITVRSATVKSGDGTEQTVSIQASTVNAMLGANGYVETEPSMFNGIVFDAADNYTITFTLGDAYNTYDFPISIGTAFANVHLAGCGKGVAFGKFSSATEDNPMFECEYPAYMFGGIANVQSGNPSGVSVAANAYKDVDVTFPKAFQSAPIVMVCLRGNQDHGATIGQCGVSVLEGTSETGFTARLYNASTNSRTLRFYWLAIGIPEVNA